MTIWFGSNNENFLEEFVNLFSDLLKNGRYIRRKRLKRLWEIIDIEQKDFEEKLFNALKSRLNDIKELMKKYEKAIVIFGSKPLDPLDTSLIIAKPPKLAISLMKEILWNMSRYQWEKWEVLSIVFFYQTHDELHRELMDKEIVEINVKEYLHKLFRNLITFQK